MKSLKLLIGDIAVAVVKQLSRRTKIDLFMVAMGESGYGKSQSLKASGELNLIKNILPKHVGKKPVIFDVGANLGEYSNTIAHCFPEADIHCFEPNPVTFEKLKARSKAKHLNNLGLGAKKDKLELFSLASNQSSVNASSDKNVLLQVAEENDIVSFDIPVDTIDSYCKQYNINQIDFLKIDTEGFEMEVLEGARQMLQSGKIKTIQFEFNEVNIVRRRYLKDFYQNLPGYSFYRINTNGLVDINDYKPRNEIFLFQNIFAIKN